MAKPPETPPNSDIDGVDEDGRRNLDAAEDGGEATENLARARRQSKGRPPYSNDLSDKDDRTK